MSKFNGSDYLPARDDARLTDQKSRILAVMGDGVSRSLSHIATLTGDPEASISAQLRHLRKPKHGSFVVDKTYWGYGEYRYSVTQAKAATHANE